MYVTALLFVSGMGLGESLPSPTWLTNYAEVQNRGAKTDRPLAVFVGAGASGMAQCCREGSLHDEAAKLLAEHYVCVYVDAEAPANKSVVDALALATGKGIVLSDRSGAHQAFYHDGDLAAADLVRALRANASAAAPAAPAETLLTFTAANFGSEVLKSKAPVLVDFYADWCGPCQRMSPTVAALGAECRGIAKVGKLNIDQHRAIASEYGVTAIPAFLVFKDGRVVDRVVGATSQAELAAKIKAALK